MAVDHIYAKTLCRNREIRLDDRTVREFANDLLRLDLNLWLLTGDVRDDIVHNIERRNAGITGTRYRLKCCQDNGFDAKAAMQCRDRRSESANGTSRVRDDKSLRKTTVRFLRFDKPHVFVIYLRDQQRHVFVHPVA